MTVQDVGRNNDHGSALNRLACDLVGFDSDPADGSYRRIEAQGLLNHGLRKGKMSTGIFCDRACAIGLASDLLLPTPVLAQQVKGPGNRIRGRFMAGSN